MHPIHFDAFLVLERFMCLPSIVANESWHYVWTASIGESGPEVPVHIFYRSGESSDSALHIEGIEVQVIGRADVVDGIIHVSASFVCEASPLPVVEGEPPNHRVVVAFAGIVVSADIDPSAPHLCYAEVRLTDDGIAADPPVIIRCAFDTRSEHLSDISRLGPGVPAKISGSLTGTVYGVFAVAVHDIRFGGEDAPCLAHGVARISREVRGLRGAGCRWLASLLRAEREGHKGSVTPAGGNGAASAFVTGGDITHPMDARDQESVPDLEGDDGDANVPYMSDDSSPSSCCYNVSSRSPSESGADSDSA